MPDEAKAGLVQEEQPLELTEKAEPIPASAEPLMLEEVVEDKPEPTPDRFAEARKVAQAELETYQRARPHKRRETSVLLRAAAVLLAVVSATAAEVQSRRRSAEAATPVVQALATPAPAGASAADPHQLYEQAMERFAAGAAPEAVSLLRRSADAGYADAQHRLAKLYERGEVIGADVNAAREWTERAANGGQPYAMHDLGVYLAQDAQTPDDQNAFRWFRQAAEYDIADSQFNLGVMYEQGRGVTENPVEALFWFQLAARQDDPAASERAAAIEARLTPLDIEGVRMRVEGFRARTWTPVGQPMNGR
jgi:localization factor PodJL